MATIEERIADRLRMIEHILDRGARPPITAPDDFEFRVEVFLVLHLLLEAEADRGKR